MDNIKDRFKNPPKDYYPVPFWFWNYRMEPDEIRRQIKEMARKGIGGGFMHARPGRITEYLSREWHQAIKVAVDEAKKQGIKAWLYDEDGWPSGTCGGKILKEHPSLRMSGFYPVQEFLIKDGTTLNENILIPENGELLYIIAFSRGKENVKILDLTKLLKNGRIHWSPKHGKWCIFTVVREWSMSVGSDYGYLDTLNPKAVDKFIQSTYTEYSKYLSSDFGKVIPGIFTDEPNCNYTFYQAEQKDWKKRKVLPWTPMLPTSFERMHRYPFIEALPGLFYEIGKKTAKYRSDYHETMVTMYTKAFYKKIYDFCKKNKLLFVGHVSNEGDLFEEIKQQGDYFQVMQYMHYTGVDYLFRLTWPPRSDPQIPIKFSNFLVALKLASSAAHLLNKPRVLCEGWGLTGWDIDFRELKRLADWEVVLGVNFICQHGFYYSIEGQRKWECPPDEFYHATYWPYYKYFSTYLSRLCYLFSRGVHVAKTVILHPTKSMWRHMGPQFTKMNKQIQADLEETSRFLLKLHYDFDYISEELLSRCSIEDSKLVFRNNNKVVEEYSVLIMPCITTISWKTARIINAFCRAGGRVIATSCYPQESTENGKDKRLGKLMRQIFIKDNLAGACLIDSPWRKGISPLKKALEKYLKREVSITENGREIKDIIYLHRQEGKIHRYFLVNTHRTKSFIVDIHLKSKGIPETWDAFTGELKSLRQYKHTAEGIVVNLLFNPEQSFILVVDSGKTRALKPGHQISQKKAEVCRIKLPEYWDFSLSKTNVLPLCNFKYKFKTCLPIKKMKLLIDENIVKEGAEVSVNKAVISNFSRGTYLDPYILEAPVQKYIKGGDNIISVTNYDKVSDGGLFLTGNFKVVKKKGRYILTAEDNKIKHGSWTEQGYPFFSGTGVYQGEVDIPIQFLKKDIFIKFSKIANMVDIYVNGVHVSFLPWPPFKADISKFVHKGRNRITLKVTNTLYNVLLEKSKPSGLLGPVEIIILQ
ncbi:MAG: glycosyl hydrolase [bacterium]